MTTKKPHAKMKPTKSWALVSNHDGILNGVFCSHSDAVRARRLWKYTQIMHITRVLVTEVVKP